jgi:hypothetical protein
MNVGSQGRTDVARTRQTVEIDPKRPSPWHWLQEVKHLSALASDLRFKAISGPLFFREALWVFIYSKFRMSETRAFPVPHNLDKEYPAQKDRSASSEIGEVGSLDRVAIPSANQNSCNPCWRFPRIEQSMSFVSRNAIVC